MRRFQPVFIVNGNWAPTVALKIGRLQLSPRVPSSRLLAARATFIGGRWRRSAPTLLPALRTAASGGHRAIGAGDLLVRRPRLRVKFSVSAGRMQPMRVRRRRPRSLSPPRLHEALRRRRLSRASLLPILRRNSRRRFGVFGCAAARRRARRLDRPSARWRKRRRCARFASDCRGAPMRNPTRERPNDLEGWQAQLAAKSKCTSLANQRPKLLFNADKEA